MNRTEFLNEVKNSPICPTDFEKIYKEFQVFQQAALGALLEVHRICEKNEIPYQLAYGSLLGLVRDGGQIPWDYDIDIIVPYEEKAKLIEAMKKDLEKDFYFCCSDSDETCRHSIMRVAPIGYSTEAIHVDVFFFVGTPEDKDQRAEYAGRIKKLSEIRFGRLVNLKEYANGDKIEMIKLFLRKKMPFLFTSVSKANEEYKKLCSEYSSAESTYCISADSFATWKEIPSALLWETKLAECDYGEIRIPVHYKELLEMFYGDYMAVPPLERRIGEVVTHHRRITWWQQKG